MIRKGKIMHKNFLLFNYLKKKAGFTLVEAFIAVTILGFCALFLFISLYAGFNLVNDIRENIIASSIIQEEMEGLRKTFFAQLPAYGESTFSNSSLSLLYNTSGTIKVDQYIDDNIVRVIVTVTWYSRLKTDKQHEKRLATLITKNGINSI